MAEALSPVRPSRRMAVVSLTSVVASIVTVAYFPDTIRGIFSAQFLPHVYCYLYNRNLIALHVGSDTAIWLSYVSISATLAYMVYRTRRQIPFSWMLLAFGMFIIACGFTHMMEVIVLWKPLYWLAGDVKLLTAVASVITAIALPPLVPKVHSMLEAAALSQERKMQLENANAQLSDLSARLLEMQDEERRRLARELHDSTGQIVAALQLNLGLVTHGSACMGEAAADALKESIRLADQVSSDVRTMSYLLHPPLLDETGLVALEWYLEGFSTRSKIQVAFTLPKDFGRLSRDLETAVFRIVQEALTNVHRHSGSDKASVSIEANEEELVLTVRDMGKGIPSGVLSGAKDSHVRLGVGISGMRERVRQLGGTLEISAANPGTIVRAILPRTQQSLGGQNPRVTVRTNND